jgi:hypothetical protein
LGRKVEEETQAGPTRTQGRDGLHVSQEGRLVTASLIVPQEDLEQQVRSQLAKQENQRKSDPRKSVEPAGNEPAGGESPTVLEAPAPRRSGGIRIDGLGSGPVEIPVTPR